LTHAQVEKIVDCILRAWEAEMDFIERMFGFAPDGGSGATELLIIGVIVAAFVLVYGIRRRTKVG
jgi:hypothetical protein